MTFYFYKKTKKKGKKKRKKGGEEEKKKRIETKQNKTNDEKRNMHDLDFADGIIFCTFT